MNRAQQILKEMAEAISKKEFDEDSDNPDTIDNKDSAKKKVRAKDSDAIYTREELKKAKNETSDSVVESEPFSPALIVAAITMLDNL